LLIAENSPLQYGSSSVGRETEIIRQCASNANLYRR
jgi:hypothetical protein